MAIKGVDSIHDLHVWTLTSGMHALSCHVVVDGLNNPHSILDEISRICKVKFSIEHTTVQLEEENRQPQEVKTCH